LQVKNFQQYFSLHFVIIILGFTAILGKLISLPAVQLVWYRTLIAFIGIFIYLKFKKINYRIPLKNVLSILGIGVIVAAHWICFFHAVKVSNVSVTLGCLATTTLFTSFLEPITQKRRISLLEVFIGLIVIVGLYMIFQFETKYTLGIIFSVICAFLAGLFSVLNKNISLKFDPTVISFYEMISGFLAISIYMLTFENIATIDLSLSTNDLIYLLLLGIVCTAYAFVVQVGIMKVLSAYTVVLSINLEPVYGIIAANFIFGESEHMTTGFYSGTLLIILSVFLYPVIKNYLQRGNKVRIS